MKKLVLPFQGFAVKGPDGVLLGSISDTKDEAQLKGADIVGNGRVRARSYEEVVEQAREHWKKAKQDGYSIVKVEITEQGNG